MTTTMYWPMLFLVLWTCGVGFLAGSRRVREIRSRRLPLASIARPRDIAGVLEDTQVMDNFNNLLQVPLLFYVWCLALGQLHVDDWPMALGAWAYVGLRVWHTIIQITHNHVVQRFRIWACSHTLMAILWLALGFRLW